MQDFAHNSAKKAINLFVEFEVYECISKPEATVTVGEYADFDSGHAGGLAVS